MRGNSMTCLSAFLTRNSDAFNHSNCKKGDQHEKHECNSFGSSARSRAAVRVLGCLCYGGGDWLMMYGILILLLLSLL